jgi:hypothetical protein
MGNALKKNKNKEITEQKNSVIDILKEEKIQNNYISSDNISNFVDDLLDNKEVNMSYLPDGIEKQIYKNLLVYGLNIVKEVISTSKIEIAGHEITFNIKPVENVQ